MIALRSELARRNCLACALGLPHRRVFVPPRRAVRPVQALTRAAAATRAAARRLRPNPEVAAALVAFTLMAGAIVAICVSPESPDANWLAGIAYGAAWGWFFARRAYRGPGRPA